MFGYANGWRSFFPVLNMTVGVSWTLDLIDLFAPLSFLQDSDPGLTFHFFAVRQAPSKDFEGESPLSQQHPSDATRLVIAYCLFDGIFAHHFLARTMVHLLYGVDGNAIR